MARALRPIVLAVDDDAGVRTALSRSLGKAGYDVRTAEGGEVAVSLARELRPDIVLLDIVMPGGPDGYSVCRDIHAVEELAFVPVIFVTALDSPQDETRAFAAGAAGYIRKPFEAEDLLAQMQEHLARSQSWACLKRPAVHWTDWFGSATLEGFKRFLIEERKTPSDRRGEILACEASRLYDLARISNLPDEQLGRYLGRFLQIPFVTRLHADDLALGVLPRAYCEKNLVAPVRGAGGRIGIVLANPFRWDLLESLNRTVWRSQRPDIALAAPGTIAQLFEEPPRHALQAAGRGGPLAVIGEPRESKDESPVLILANELLRGAVEERASDIHFEPKDRFTLVRFRIDGDMQDVRTLDPTQAGRIISRLKALSGMDIAERRRPQDGSVEVQVGRHRLKLRLATSSTSDGETLVVRLLEPTKSAVPLEALGMTPQQSEVVSALVNRHQGMILVVGPTGSGKSTTIFSFLSKLDGRTRSIMSVEDPVEYRIPFANQQQVNERAGVSFEALLRSAVRQDPDVLFLGEIRDDFSAKASLDFASSGHLTVSTMHAANAATAIFRLERLGILRSAMADSLLGVVAQRLVKKLCPHCRTLGPPTGEEAAMLTTFGGAAPARVARPVGCPACRDTGYLGREGVYEILRFDPTLSELVRSGVSVNRIRAHCVERGDYLMYHHALDKVAELTFCPADASAQVLLEEVRFRQASDARTLLGLEGEAPPGALGSPTAGGPTSGSPPVEPTPDPVASAPVQGAVPARTTGAAGDPGGAILVVEDQLVTSTLVEAILKSAGYRVTVAPDGVDALLALGQGSFGAIVSDINMPNLGGLELLTMLQAKGVDIPVLFMTGDTSEDLESQVLDRGAVDFIRKPLRPDVLIGRVRNALRRRAATAGTAKV